MLDNLATKVVLKHTVLHGSDSLQRVATVYIEGREYRVSAPSEATGDSLDWVDHFIVTKLLDFNSEVDVHDALGILALKVVEEELKKQKRDENKVAGMHPDGRHYDAQICVQGHVQTCDGKTFDSRAHCNKCGASCIDECPSCKEPIRGVESYRPTTEYCRPQFCQGCGRPYPWMQERLNTGRELLDHDDKLSLDERNQLWGDLQYVMSDPEADLVPAKKKLINITLGKATDLVRAAILDLMAKTAAEVLKG